MRLFAFAEDSGFKQIIAFLLIILFSALIFSGIGVVSAFLIWGGDVINEVGGMSSPQAVDAARYMQGWFHAGMFLVPSLIFAALSGTGLGNYLSIKKFPAMKYLLFALALYIIASPLIGTLMEWNSHLSLPSWLSGVEEWMRSQEDKAKIATEALMKTRTSAGLWANLLIMAVLPALGEEFMFRGVLMRWFSGFIKNIHLNIALTALLFSALHMQFFGFFPRMALGILFGYLLYWSGSIWLPVIVHFLNNGSMVLLYYLFYKGSISVNPEDIGTADSAYLLIFNTILVILGFVWFSRTSKSRGDTLKF